MSAYIVDPRTIDYLVQWAHFRSQRDLSAHLSAKQLAGFEEAQPQAVSGFRVHLIRILPDDLGQILVDENVRSVRARYETCAPDDLPGPVDQSRVWRYRFQPVDHARMYAAWVIKACDCLDYQSCETEDWKDTVAYALLQAIRESAIHALTENAPWGVSDEDLAKAPASTR